MTNQTITTPRPDLHAGLAYWNSVAQRDISNNAVLGGFGLGSLPRVDGMGSRMFLLTIRPELSTIDTGYGGSQSRERGERGLYRALDLGAGIGRVTKDVLLYLFDRIDLVEPITPFIHTAKRNATNGNWPHLKNHPSSPQKAVRFWKKSIQDFIPSDAIITTHPSSTSPPISIAHSCDIVGAKDGWNVGCGYDVIWAQWTLGHLADEELVEFLKKCKDSLRPPTHSHQPSERAQECPSFERDGGLIIIKENIFISESDPDGDHFLFDKQDSSLTRSHQSFLRIFKLAGLSLIKQEIQRGFDPDLYRVNFYALQ